jgi:hypothetical protein
MSAFARLKGNVASYTFSYAMVMPWLYRKTFALYRHFYLCVALVARQRITSCPQIQHRITNTGVSYLLVLLESFSLKITASAISPIGLRKSMLFF